MKLLSFFKLTYLLPSSIFLLISILISFFCSITFLDGYTSDKHIEQIGSKNDKKDWILISSIQELLFHRIQLVFDYLITSKLYLNDFYSKVENSFTQNEQTYITNHLINLKSYYLNKYQINESNYLDKMAFIIDGSFSEIILNKELFTELSKKEILQIKYLYIYSQIIPIFKSFYKNFEKKEGFSLDSLYIMNRKTETFALYPIKDVSYYEKIFSFFSMSNSDNNFIRNPNNCKNKKREIPDYFYIFCREAFKSISYAYKENPERTMFITSPYKNLFDNKTDSDYVISICHIFNFTNKNSDKSDDDYYLLFLNDEIIICADIVINNYFEIFMKYEQQLTGYFYITKTFSRFPLFFPGMDKDLYPNDITRFEFNYSYYDFSTTDVVNFNTYILPKLTKEYNNVDELILPYNNENKDNYSLYFSVNNTDNTFKKGNLELKYFIYPVYFNDSNNSKKEHVLSIVYIVDKNLYIKQLNFLSTKLYLITFLNLFITILYSCMLIYVIHYIIYFFAKNITKPIKVKLKQNAKISQKKYSKYTYQGVDINKLISLGLVLKKAKKHKIKSEQDDESSVNDFDRNANDIFGRFIYGNENLLNKNKEKEDEAENLLEKEKNDYKDFEGDDSEDEGLLSFIDFQFNDKLKQLFDLNKVRSFMKGQQFHLRGSTITNFIDCHNIYNEIKDKLRESVCLSNVGNLENLNKKYDKSIIFLSKSLNIENYTEEINSKEILNIINSIFDKDQKIKIPNKDYREYNPVLQIKTGTKKEEKNKKKKLNENVSEEVIDTDLSDVQFLRFIKLFYAYNKYFSNVKTIENILNKTLHMTKTKGDEESYVYNYVKASLVFFNDYFNLDIPQVHKNYKNAILICLKKLIESKIVKKKKEKILYCYIELFHYYIAYLKILIKRIINDINKNNNDDESENKKKVAEIQRVHKTFIDKVFHVAKKSNEYITKFKFKISGHKNGLIEGEKAKYKELLNSLQKIEDKSNNIEFNIFLIEQRYYYCFAKLAKLCGDYSTAIINYLKVIDEKRLISNGVLCLKANKKICNIINFARYNPGYLSINEKDEKKLNEIYEKCKKQIKELQKVDYKDLIVVLDKNYNNKDAEKVYKLRMEQYKAINNIFEKFISTNDRFSLYTYGNEHFNFDHEVVEDEDINAIKNSSVKKLVGLSYKKKDNLGFIKGVIEKFHENIINDYENKSNMKNAYLNTEQNKNFSFNLDNSIMKEKNGELDDYYINKKKLRTSINIIFKIINEANNTEEQRKKYVIVITESFKDGLSSEKNETFDKKDYFKDINYISKSKIEKLYIIGSLLDEKNLFNDINKELANHGVKNEYLEFENISELNNKFRNIGSLPRKYEYFNENSN